MGALSEVIKDRAKRKAIVDDGERLLDQEVADKSGVSGLAVKAGFKVIKGIRPGMIPMALDGLLDDFSARVDPFYEAFKASGEKDIRAYFTRRGAEIANALLAITDGRAERTDHKALRTAYYQLRPQAEKHVIAAMPRVADMIRRHCG